MYKMTDERVTLIDGVARNASHPDTFEIPDNAARESVLVGQAIKIGLEIPDIQGERFWVEVTDILDGGNYRGWVNNDLVYFDLPYKAEITFQPRHVLMVLS